MAGCSEKDLEKWVDMYNQLPKDARIIILSNANVLLASEEMRKQRQESAP